jgi:hypothetical protein
MEMLCGLVAGRGFGLCVRCYNNALPLCIVKPYQFLRDRSKSYLCLTRSISADS